jgi:hypothetical protein
LYVTTGTAIFPAKKIAISVYVVEPKLFLLNPASAPAQESFIKYLEKLPFLI